MRQGRTNLLNAQEMAANPQSVAFSLQHLEHWGLVASWTDTTPAAGTVFTTDFATDDQLDSTAHGTVQDQIVQLTTTTTLPAGLATATDYFVRFIDANTLELSLTRGGAAVDITDDGTGTHTMTAQAISITMTVQYAVKGETAAEIAETDWVDSTSNIVITGTPLIGTLAEGNVGYRWMRINVVVGTGGSGALTVDVSAKGTG